METVKEVEERFCSKCVHKGKCYQLCAHVLAFIYGIDLHNYSGERGYGVK